MMTGVTIFSATRVIAGELQPTKEQNFPVSLSMEEHSLATLCSSPFKANQSLKKRLFFFPLKARVAKGTNNICKKAEDSGS